MSKMFDYIVNGGGKVAELEASLEHTAGYLGFEIEENEKLRAENERLRAALMEIAEFQATEPWRLTARTMREMARDALTHEQSGESK